jgi:hypothetical protein
LNRRKKSEFGDGTAEIIQDFKNFSNDIRKYEWVSEYGVAGTDAFMVLFV